MNIPSPQPPSEPRTKIRRRWQAQCRATVWIRQRFGAKRALTYLVGEKFFNLVRDLERDRRLAPEVEDFAGRIRTIFPQVELREYFRRARARRHPGVPTEDLRYPPDEALFVSHMKMLLLVEPLPAARS